MTLTQGDIVIDCADHDVVVGFWAAALGWTPHRVNEQYVSLAPPRGDPRVPLLFQKVPEPKSVKNRVHVDWRTDGPLQEEVGRLVGLGARVLAERSLGSFRWVVLADPEGNEFCVAAG